MIGVSFFGQCAKGQKSSRKGVANSLRIQQLEDRSVPSTFSVLNLQNSGPGSLRQAILSANANPGADVIDFNVAGTIRLTSGALPTITGAVDIDGTAAPGFAGSPVVAVDFNNHGGLRFVAGSAGSDLRSLGLVNAAAAGVTINGVGNMLVAGNFIGLSLDGSTVAGNRGDGLSLNTSSGDTIGGTCGPGPQCHLRQPRQRHSLERLVEQPDTRKLSLAPTRRACSIAATSATASW